MEFRCGMAYLNSSCGFHLEEFMSNRVLFARIGYMKYYAGPQPGDERPKHGGKYNREKIGHEVYNFHRASGWVYGYVQPYIKERADVTLNLGRIDRSSAKKDTIP